MHPFLIALQFLTRVPLRSKEELEEKQIAQSVLYYPLVGALIGVALWLMAVLVTAIPPIMAAVILLLFWVLITGGLHLDGLADSADAWAGGYGDKQRSLEIMKDPAAGPFAVVVLVLLLLVKLSALTVLLETDSVWILIVPPVLGRLSVVVMFLTTPYVRKNGLGSIMSEYLSRSHAFGVIFLSAIFGLVFYPALDILLTIAVTFITLYFLRYLMMKRIQGMTGDTIGASLEINEAVSLFILVLLVS